MNKPKKCAGKESFQRINYLYQACNAIATNNEANNLAATMYSNLLIAISRKSVQRLDIDMKRSICKGCRSLLLAGVTCRVRIKKKRCRWICLKCHTVKSFDVKNREYQIWTEQEESVVEILDYEAKPTDAQSASDAK